MRTSTDPPQSWTCLRASEPLKKLPGHGPRPPGRHQLPWGHSLPGHMLSPTQELSLTIAGAQTAAECGQAVGRRRAGPIMHTPAAARRVQSPPLPLQPSLATAALGISVG